MEVLAMLLTLPLHLNWALELPIAATQDLHLSESQLGHVELIPQIQLECGQNFHLSVKVSAY